MKVFITFGQIRCVVPVGDGSLTVKQATELAIERYRKAISKPLDYKITVSTVKTCRDGAILDPDDILNDVADDREQLIALFEEMDDTTSHYYSNTDSFYGEMPPTRSVTINNNNSHIQPQQHSLLLQSTKSNVSYDYRHNNGNNLRRQSGIHPLTHYSCTTTAAASSNNSIYARTNGISNNNGNTSGNNILNHQRSDSISDSLLSSNESPDVFQHDSLPEDGFCHQLNGMPTTNYSYRESFHSTSSTEMKLPPPAQCRPIPIANSRRTEYLLSRSFDYSNVNSVGDDECDDVVEITADQINSYTNVLHVRHGSEPTLNCQPSSSSCRVIPATNSVPKQCSLDSMANPAPVSHSSDLCAKRWSTAIAVEQQQQPPAAPPSSQVTNYEHLDENKSFNSISPQSTKEEGYASEERSNSQSESSAQPMSSPGNHKDSSFGRFNRGSGRLSMIVNNLDVWADAADRQLMRLHNNDDKNSASKPEHKQQVYDSSLGSMSNSSQETEHHHHYDQQQQQESKETISVIIDLAKESGPLGIHVLPDVNSDSPLLKDGLLIEGIEPGGRIDRDGRLHVGDTIIEIDSKKFAGLNFEEAQNIFRSSLKNEKIRLKIIKSLSSICDSTYQQANTDDKPTFSEREVLVESSERVGQQTKMATVTSTRKHSTTGIIGPKAPNSALVIANTRRIGKKYHIQLQKGDHGLGFTITTRDNPAGGLSPIYIKTILPRGAAVQDGRLKPGDRLLEVCGIEMTGKSQEEAVKILRNLPQDSIVDLIVSRQELEMSPSPLMPRQIPPEKANEPVCSSANQREVMTFKIPLNDTGSAGLGISVKGKTCNVEGNQRDSGIFIKSVIHGGAASKDGRLKPDDQLININEITLAGKTNSEAMETLRREMIHSADNITLIIARRNCQSPSHCTDVCSNTTTRSYRHQHDMSVLSTDSYDMSFTNHHTVHSAHTSPYSHNDSGCHEEDSYRSSENTVIYNSTANKCSPATGGEEKTNNEPNSKSLNSSEHSLNDDNGGDGDGGERFRRDGFGRQSMSEKRHAQLDAKNTDTYRRSKKCKDERQDRKSQSVVANTPSESARVSRITVPAAGAYGEDEQLESEDVQRIKPTPHSNGNCQSPGSCPCRSKSEISADMFDQRANERFVKSAHFSPPPPPTQSKQPTVTSPFGLRKSCSLESLQTMMQDWQKEQVGQVGANITTVGNNNTATTTTARQIRVRNRDPNESFRVAVDRSYEHKNGLNNSTEDSHEDSPSTCPHRIGGGHSMVSTNFTATTTNLTGTTTEDDNAQLIKSKKKKGIFKNLFHFGSRKGRSKSISSDSNETTKHCLAKENSESTLCGDVNRKYQMEQERIRQHYVKLLEQQKSKQQYGFVRNQLHPMHQSMPMSLSHRSKSGGNQNSIKMEPMIQTMNRNPYNSGSNLYGVINRDTVGVPQKGVHLRQHRVYPEMPKDSCREPNSQMRISGNGPQHIRINSQDFYNRNTDRPGSRVAISENNNYATYVMYSNYNGSGGGGNHSSSGLPNISHYNTYRENIDKNIHHYRQLSLRNPSTHHGRQVSSPAANTITTTTQQQYCQHRPVSSYFEYEQHSANMEQMRKNSSGQLPYPSYNGESVYGVVGQMGNQSNLIRKQQPIYQSNMVEIYGSVPNRPTTTTYHPNNNRTNIQVGYPRNEIIYNTNGLPSQYITKG